MMQCDPRTALLHRIRGFTLIELLVTLALLALLVGTASPVWQLHAKREKERELKRALWQIREAIDAYKQASDQGLIARSADSNGYPPSLQVLVTGVSNARDPEQKRKLRFLRRIPRDPFAVDDSIPNIQTWHIHGYDGALDAEASDVFDVSSRATGTGINQQAYAEW